MRVGYALGGAGSEALLEQLEPPLGVGALAQAGALEALRKTTRDVERRSQRVVAERARLADALADLNLDAAPSQTNTLWVSAPGIEGEELAARLRPHGGEGQRGRNLRRNRPHPRPDPETRRRATASSEP